MHQGVLCAGRGSGSFAPGDPPLQRRGADFVQQRNPHTASLGGFDEMAYPHRVRRAGSHPAGREHARSAGGHAPPHSFTASLAAWGAGITSCALAFVRLTPSLGKGIIEYEEKNPKKRG